MPIISPRSQSEFNNLKTAGSLKEEGILIDLGKEVLATVTLDTLLSRYKSGHLDTSLSTAESFIKEVYQVSQSQEIQKQNSDIALSHASLVRKKWRIDCVNAKNFRGLTEWGGEFGFEFKSKPYLIFGLNGSGKTSILSAIIWCLTGMCLKERCEPDAEGNSGIDLFCINDATEPIISNWPFVVTIPHNKSPEEIRSITPICFVEVKLRGGDDEQVIVKRNLHRTSSTLEILNNLNEKLTLKEIGIGELDLELSLFMPARVMTIQFKPGSKISENLISIAGLGALQDIGSIARGLNRSIAKHKNSMKEKADELRKQATEYLKKIQHDEFKEIWDQLQKDQTKYTRDKNESNYAYQSRILVEQGKSIEEQAKKEFELISNVLGVAPSNHEERKQLIETLKNARLKIGENSNAWEPLKSWKAISSQVIQEATDLLNNEMVQIAEDVATQYQLWLKNKSERGLLLVKSNAARYCKQTDSFELCPVCNQYLSEDVREALKELANQKTELASSLRQIISDLDNRLASCIPNEISKLNIDISAIDQVRSMLKENIWKHIKELGKLKENFEKSAKEIISNLSIFEIVEKKRHFGHDEWDSDFLAEIKKLEDSQYRALAQLSLAKWIIENISAMAEYIDSFIFFQSKETDTPMVALLETLEEYAGQFKILDTIRITLIDAACKYNKADELEREAAKANCIHEILDRLKDMDKYANILLNKDLDSVSSEMKSNYDSLYPTDPIRLETIASQKARAGTKPDYRFRLKWAENLLADAEPVANLGRMRALLWSFAFALLLKHNPALETIIIDDPCISLDDFHAKNMIEHIITQKLAAKYQPIVTIHQEHLLHETWGRDPSGEHIGFAKVLARGESHRNCRIQPSWEPLSYAIQQFERDRNNWDTVIEKARITLENHLKALSSYLMTEEVSTKTLEEIIGKLKQVRDGSRIATSIGKFVNVGELIRICEEKIVKHLLNISHHGGADRSLLTAHDADDVIKVYKNWQKVIRNLYSEIEAVLNRSKLRTTIDIESFRLLNMYLFKRLIVLNKYTPFQMLKYSSIRNIRIYIYRREYKINTKNHFQIIAEWDIINNNYCQTSI